MSLEADVAPFCFPDAARWQRSPDVWGRSAADGGAAYTLVVTDQHGGRSYGFCPRLTADTGEQDAVTLPIAYCLLTRHDAPAFYSKVSGGDGGRVWKGTCVLGLRVGFEQGEGCG